MKQSTKSSKTDLYQEVTDRIIMALENGTVPWLKPWNNPEFNTGLPKNAASNRHYSGINILLLWLSAAEHGYKQCKWITTNGANKLGGRIRKGERATRVINYRPVEREKLDEDGNLLLDDNGNPKIERFAYIKAHPLFNLDQCEGLPAELYEVVKEPENNGKNIHIQEFSDIKYIIEGMALNIVHKPSARAFYRPSQDLVVMPEMKQFDSEQGYYSVLLHEITHATGHAKRLNREGITSGKAKFGNKVYAFEELVAEMGGAFLCAYLRFDTVPNNANYIASWIEVLRKDKKAIFKASGLAREACGYMLDCRQVISSYEQPFAA